MPHLGIAVATTLGGWLNAILLWRGLKRRGYLELDAQTKRSLPRIVLASLAMGGALVILADLLAPWLAPRAALLHSAPALATLVGAGAVLYFVVAAGLGVLGRATIKAAFSRGG